MSNYIRPKNCTGWDIKENKKTNYKPKRFKDLSGLLKSKDFIKIGLAYCNILKKINKDQDFLSHQKSRNSKIIYLPPEKIEKLWIRAHENNLLTQKNLRKETGITNKPMNWIIQDMVYYGILEERSKGKIKEYIPPGILDSSKDRLEKGSSKFENAKFRSILKKRINNSHLEHMTVNERIGYFGLNYSELCNDLDNEIGMFEEINSKLIDARERLIELLIKIHLREIYQNLITNLSKIKYVENKGYFLACVINRILEYIEGKEFVYEKYLDKILHPEIEDSNEINKIALNYLHNSNNLENFKDDKGNKILDKILEKINEKVKRKSKKITPTLNIIMKDILEQTGAETVELYEPKGFKFYTPLYMGKIFKKLVKNRELIFSKKENELIIKEKLNLYLNLLHPLSTNASKWDLYKDIEDFAIVLLNSPVHFTYDKFPSLKGKEEITNPILLFCMEKSIEE